MLLSVAIALGLLTGLGVLVWYVVAAPASQALCPTLTRGSGAGAVIALTFDDGPGEQTPQILDILKAAGVRATFFLCGSNVELHPEHARRIADEGHEVANHTYSHPRLLGRSPGKIAWEIDRAQKVIEHATGRRPRWFRPPYGLRWFGLAAILERQGMHAAMWSVNGRDWKRPAAAITEQLLRQTHPGAIILLHDGLPPGETGDRQPTVKALQAALRLLGGRYRFVTVSEIAGDSPR
jgi:peptidoglycan/xylan/chitin deacetylase (PgdA/CDA1 family)